jgi:hypothetical protein
MELLEGLGGQDGVAKVGRVEGPAKQADARAHGLSIPPEQ